MDPRCLVKTVPNSASTSSSRRDAHLVEAKYSPLGLQAKPRTGALWPVMAPNSAQSSTWSAVVVHRHRRQPPLQPQARTSLPSWAQSPPTKPPSRWPPTSPKRCLLIQRLVVPCCDEPKMVDGDHRITDESVEVDSSVDSGNAAERGRQDRLVIPAS